MVQEVVSVSTTPEPWPLTADETVSTEELIRRSGAKPFSTLSDLPADPFGDDAEYEAFLADLYASRRSDVA